MRGLLDALAPGDKTACSPNRPNYTACIAHLQATTAKPAKGQKPPTPAALKTQCEQQYKSLQPEVLGFLISSQLGARRSANRSA